MIKSVLPFFMLFLLTSFSLKANLPSDSTQVKTDINRTMLTTSIVSSSLAYAGGISYLSFIWYKDHERVPFHFYNDNSGYLQMDKMGHAYASYFESYMCYNWLRKAGISKQKALLYGGTAGFIMQLPIEVFDGLYEGWGFSWGDIFANTLGSALLIGQEALFDEQIVRPKMSFSKSEYFDKANGYLGKTVFDSFFYDYNSHTHWFSANANRFFLKNTLPSWLSLSVGYSANGMFGEFTNRQYYQGVKLPQIDRTRQFLFSLDVDWEKIPTHSKFLKTVFKGLNFIKLPFPAIEINSKGAFKGYWLYF
ncbi:MAG: DUF2279 domain-containing protein [Prolixibacteraceae bacterium]|jgi:hypothetical protein|nr:DUF2279 domain-containing protein [Prolixibacteraceae bacterium]